MYFVFWLWAGKYDLFERIGTDPLTSSHPRYLFSYISGYNSMQHSNSDNDGWIKSFCSDMFVTNLPIMNSASNVWIGQSFFPCLTWRFHQDHIIKANSFNNFRLTRLQQKGKIHKRPLFLTPPVFSFDVLLSGQKRARTHFHSHNFTVQLLVGSTFYVGGERG